MDLRTYIEKASPPGEPLGLKNITLQRVAYRARCSPAMLYAISRRVRFASRELAERIAMATDGRVEAASMLNPAPSKRGPRPKGCDSA